MLSIVLGRLRRRLILVEALGACIRWGAWAGLLGVALAVWRPLQPAWVYALPSLVVGLAGVVREMARSRPDALLAEVADQATGGGALFRTALEVPQGSRWGGPVHVRAMEAAQTLSSRRAIPLRVRGVGYLIAVLGLAMATSRVVPRLRWSAAPPGSAPVEVDDEELVELRALSGRLERAADDQGNEALRAASAELAALDLDLQAEEPLGELELLARLGAVRENLARERRRVAGRAAVRRTLAEAPGLEQLVREGRAPRQPSTPEEEQALREALESSANAAADPELATHLRRAAELLDEDPAAALADLERTLAALPARYADERTDEELRKAAASLEELRAGFGAPEGLDPDELAERLKQASPEELEAWLGGESPEDDALAEALEALDPDEREVALREAQASGDVAEVDSGDPGAEVASVPQPGEPASAAGPADPRGAGAAEPGDPVAEADPTQPANPAEPGDPVAEADPTQPAHPAEPGDPVAEADPPQPADPPEPGDPVAEADPTQPADPTEPGDAVAEADPVDPPAESEAGPEATADATPPGPEPRARTDRPPPGPNMAERLLDSPALRLLAEEMLETMDKETLKDLLEFARDQAGDEPPQLPERIPPGLGEKLAELDPEVLRKVAEAASELTPPETPPNVPPSLAESLRDADPELLRRLAELAPPPQQGSQASKPGQRTQPGHTASSKPAGPQAVQPGEATGAGQAGQGGQPGATGQPLAGQSGDSAAGQPAADASQPGEAAGNPGEPVGQPGEAAGNPGEPGVGQPGATGQPLAGQRSEAAGNPGEAGQPGQAGQAGSPAEPASGRDPAAGGDPQPLDADVEDRIASLDPALRERVERWLERHPRRLVRTRAQVGFEPGRTVNLDGVERAMERQRVPASYEDVIREYFRRDAEPSAPGK